MTYNKTKTQVYANAIVRLQCVVSDSQSLKGKSAALANIKPPPSLSDVSDPAKSKQCKAKDDSESAQVRLALAQYEIAKERRDYAAGSLIRLSPAILAAVDTIDVRAFAASQSGVPDSDQIAKGAQAATSFIKPSTGAANATALNKNLVLNSEGLSDLEKEERFANLPDCSTWITDSADAKKAIDASLATIQLPDPKFAECFAIKAYEESSANAGTKLSTSMTVGGSNNSSKGNTGNQSGNMDQSGNGGGSTSTSQKPDKVAFQILPSDIVYVDPSKPSANPDIKIVGGTPPYRWAVVDPEAVRVVQASQNDLFVGLQVALIAKPAADPPREKKVKQLKVNKEKNPPQLEQAARILIADQAGAEEVVYVKPAPATAK